MVSSFSKSSDSRMKQNSGKGRGLNLSGINCGLELFAYLGTITSSNPGSAFLIPAVSALTRKTLFPLHGPTVFPQVDTNPFMAKIHFTLDKRLSNFGVVCNTVR